MNERNAILVAVVAIAIVAAAVGGILLMNPGSNTANVNSEGSTDIRPTGPAGTVTAVEVASATVNRTNASAFTELSERFNVTPRNLGIPDTLMMVAVTNNRMDAITLNTTSFVAVLDNDTSVKALNNRSMVVGPNVTVFPVLGFQTDGANITSVEYRNGSLSFSVTMTSNNSVTVPGIVTKTAPTGNMTIDKNLTFTDIAAWNVTRGGDAPIGLRFNNSSMVLALMTATNNNTTSVSLKASDFYLDIGNGTWVQGDDDLNNNVPAQLANNTTVPFLIGFRLADNMTSNGSVYYWPGEGNQVAKVPLNMTSILRDAPLLSLEAMWNDTMSGNGTSNNNSSTSELRIEMMAIGNTSVSDLTNITVWTMKEGRMNVTSVPSADNKSLNVTVSLKQGDSVTLLSYGSGNETRYIWLRSVERT